MNRYTIVTGSTDQTIYVFIPDVSSSVNGGLTGLVYNSTGLVCYYGREKTAAAQLTLATQTVTGAHSDGGFIEVSAANSPGLYRLDLSDAVCAVGVGQVWILLLGAANMVPIDIHITLVAGGPVELVVQDATHAHVADNVVLPQAHLLSVADASHA